MTWAENQRRIDALVRGLDWSKATDILVQAFHDGTINLIPGTAWNRPFGECRGERSTLV